jgi:predicted ATPase
MLGDTLFWLGELASARAHLEQGLALYNPQQHRSDVFLYGYDPGVFGLSYTALVLWFLGYPDQALKRNHEALALAQELSHPVSLASALVFAARLHQYRREVQLTQERAEAFVALSIERGFALWVVWGTLLQGWALVEQGEEEEGIAQIRQGLAAYQAMGAGLGRSDFLALLAEAYGKVGQAEEGLSVLTEALAVVDKTGEHFYEADLYRLRGELTLQRFQVLGSEFHVTDSRSPMPDVQGEAEACFLKAIEIAQCQQAKSLELRAVMSLSRLWQSQGKKAEARQMLAEIYGWFTEGFDTKDLQEAQTLLAELAT